jgi:hypothetical protein
MRLIAAIAALCSLAMPTIAGELLLQLPIDCNLGKNCHIQQYVDRDPGPGAQDFTCGALSYDGHKGTDFGLPSLKAMQQGVNVLAAASGVVTGMRDGMEDVEYTRATASQTEGRECGNGVVVNHGNGWQTQYCHLKRGSVRVRSGDRISAGDVLGQVGLSGKTQFPHVHLSVRKDGKVVDPFAPVARDSCGASGKTLWASAPNYAATGILNAGFATRIPSFAEVKDGPTPPSLQQSDPALVLWAYGYGAKPGDLLHLNIQGPNGTLINQDIVLEKTQAQYFRAIGKKRPKTGFAAGRYTGTIKLTRDGRVVDQSQIQAIIN